MNSQKLPDEYSFLVDVNLPKKFSFFNSSDFIHVVDIDLVTILGSKSRVSEILNRKRKLSLSMIRVLHNKLNTPASSLIADYSGE